MTQLGYLFERVLAGVTIECHTYRVEVIGSDHGLVVANFRLKLARGTRPQAARRIDMERLKEYVLWKRVGYLGVMQ